MSKVPKIFDEPNQPELPNDVGEDIAVTEGEALETLLARLDTNTAADQLYQTLLCIRSQYSNVEGPCNPGIVKYGIFLTKSQETSIKNIANIFGN